MVSILAEVETLHLAGEQQFKDFGYEKRMCRAKRTLLRLMINTYSLHVIRERRE